MRSPLRRQIATLASSASVMFRFVRYGLVFALAETIALLAFRYSHFLRSDPLSLANLAMAAGLNYLFLSLGVGVTAAALWLVLNLVPLVNRLQWRRGLLVAAALLTLLTERQLASVLRWDTSYKVFWLSYWLLLLGFTGGLRVAYSRLRLTMEGRRLSRPVWLALKASGVSALFVMTCAGGLRSNPSRAVLTLPPVTVVRSAMRSSVRMPNVILITIDALRSDHLNCLGYRSRTTTPNLDALARKGVLFAGHRSQSSWTRSSITSILTSLYPEQHNSNWYVSSLCPGAVTLPDALRERGYRCLQFTGLPAAVDTGFGFDEVHSQYPLEIPFRLSPISGQPFVADPLFRASRVSRALALGQQLLERRFGLLFCEDGHPEWYVNSRRVNAGIRRCLQTTSSEPLFMHVHYVEPHWPYLGSVYPWIQHLGRSPENLGRMVSYYDRAIRQVDTAVSDLLGFLDSLGVGQNSLLVITSDHGEEFLDHGGWGHAHDIYQELLCVPLILVFPSALTGGRVIHAASRSIDIAPSVLALLGIPPPPEMEGSSLLPLIRGLERSSRPVISQFSAPVGDPRSTMKRFDALLVGDWKYVSVETENTPQGKKRNLESEVLRRCRRRATKRMEMTEPAYLFELKRDPGEKVNLAHERPGLVATLKGSLDSLREHMRRTALPVSCAELTQERRSELRSLGYIE